MAIPIWAIIVVFLWMFYVSVSQISIVSIVLAIIIVSFVGSIWFYTRYRIENQQLIINYGFIKQTINIKDIRFFRKTTNPFVSPSLSIHKLEINYDKFETVQISPKDEDLFIKQLKELNSSIEYKQ